MATIFINKNALKNALLTVSKIIPEMDVSCFSLQFSVGARVLVYMGNGSFGRFLRGL
jgi:hypothetical protein